MSSSTRIVICGGGAIGAAIAYFTSRRGARSTVIERHAVAGAASGKSIFIAIHATWCPTCKAQKPILSELMAEPKFKDLVYFVVDFDSQKDAVYSFGAQMQSTLIAFKGEHETGRSVGDTDRSSIAALLNKTL